MDDRALSQWLLLKMYRNFKPEDKFCDIGPGKGRTFQTAQFLGLDLEMVAYEPDRFSASHLDKTGLKVVEEFRNWRQDDAQKKKTILSRAAATLKRSAKGAIASRFFPGNLKNFVKYQRFKHLTRRNRRKNVYDVLSSPYFQSVSDRIYIQMVCSKTRYKLSI